MNSGLADRSYWVDTLTTIAGPVLRHMAAGQLKAVMPVEGAEERKHFSHLEAIARTLTGIAPWLAIPAVEEAEEQLRQEYAGLARQSIAAAVDPASPDYVNFRYSHQPIVDAAFLAHAVLRAPEELWHKLEEPVKLHLVQGLKDTRTRKPFFCNWLLFSAIIEAALFYMGEEWDSMRVDYALKQHEQWYLGDGIYGDGPEFHWDYYNSFVIQPMLLDIIRVVGAQEREWAAMQPSVEKRAIRYGAVLERMIAPDGTFPAIGRSLAYRFGSMHLLSQLALMHKLPEEVHPAQVRSALTAVIRRTMEVPGTFDGEGWLRIGLAGSQPDIGEGYISTGSLYLCTAVFLALGLPATDEFWAGEPRDWTAKKVWAGQPAVLDHALH